MRLAADVSAESAAGLLGVDRSKVSAIEQGIRAISEERLRSLACHCDCADEKYVEALVAMTQTRKRGWWERYRGSLSAPILDIAELEAHATRMRCAHSVHIPGLLQTSDHALALFRFVVPACRKRRSPCDWPIAWSASRYWRTTRRPNTSRSSTRRRCVCSSAEPRSPGRSWNT